MNSDSPKLFTIGHSNHDWETFVDLLLQHRIQVLADVRSQPWSRYTTHFNREAMQAELKRIGVQYLFMGDQLGGRPPGEDFYDDQGHVLYFRVAESPTFLAGIDRLRTGIQKYRVAIMCSEEDPTVCHRFLLVTRVLAERGVSIEHIRGDGSLQSEEIVCNLSRDNRLQGMLFQEMEKDTWRSLKSVIPKGSPSVGSPDGD